VAKNGRGFLYLVMVMDWHSRCVLAWRLTSPLLSSHSGPPLSFAMMRSGKPDAVLGRVRPFGLNLAALFFRLLRK